MKAGFPIITSFTLHLPTTVLEGLSSCVVVMVEIVEGQNGKLAPSIAETIHLLREGDAGRSIESSSSFRWVSYESKE